MIILTASLVWLICGPGLWDVWWGAFTLQKRHSFSFLDISCDWLKWLGIVYKCWWSLMLTSFKYFKTAVPKAYCISTHLLKAYLGGCSLNVPGIYITRTLPQWGKCRKTESKNSLHIAQDLTKYLISTCIKRFNSANESSVYNWKLLSLRYEKTPCSF